MLMMLTLHTNVHVTIPIQSLYFPLADKKEHVFEIHLKCTLLLFESTPLIGLPCVSIRYHEHIDSYTTFQLP
jgi:hypothetical protein